MAALPPTTSRWRRYARQTIADVLAKQAPTATLAEKRAALRAAYPFGQRQYLPYKHWCLEVRLALGLPGKNGGRRNTGRPVVPEYTGPTLFDAEMPHAD